MDTLLESLDAEDEWLRMAAVVGMRNFPEDRARQALRIILGNHRADLMKERMFVSQLLEMGHAYLNARSRFDCLSQAAVYSLAEIGEDEDRERLLHLMVHGDPLVRTAAAEGLAAKWSSAAIRDTILARVKREEGWVRDQLDSIVDQIDRDAALGEGFYSK